MSLRVWLPLTKDLRNQGLDDVTVTNNGATFNSAGKLGGCYYFNGDKQWLQFSSVLGEYYNNDWSIACWLKPTDSTRSVIISEYNTSGASNVGLELTTSRVIRLYWNGSPDINFTTAGALPLNEWTHLVVTKAGRVVKVYFNGGLKQTYTNSSDFSTRTSAAQPRIGDDYRGNSANTVSYQGYMNDFRMYDHCLSPMEVKELSKGLVLHYPLNRGGWGQENLLLNTGTPATWSQGLNSNNYATHDCFKTQSPVPSLFSVDELITISFDWSTTATGGNFHVECGAVTPWVWGTVISSKGTRNSASNYIDITSSNQSGHVEITFKITSSQTGAANTLQWLRIRQDGTDTASKTFTISKAKLERGSIATPWCPNSSDTLATTMGLNSTTEYDCSGFCNNGTRTGTFTWTSDTPKYSVSTAFNGSQYITEDNEIETTDSTIAAWVKTSLSANAFILDCRNSSGAGKQPIYQYTNGFIQSGGASQYVTTNTGLLVANTWIHLAIVQNGSSLLVYKNGSLFQTLSCTNSPIIKPTIGARYSLSGLLPSGSLSDLRIYVTALSASDVKSLYQNCATIDPDGTIRGQIRS